MPQPQQAKDTHMSIWDDYRGADNQFKFATVGDNIAGTLTSVRLATMPDGDKVPALVIRKDDGTEWSLLVGNADLQRKLAAFDPQPGCRIAIAYTHDEHVGKPSPMKRFDVAVKPGEPVAAAQPAGAGATQTSAPAGATSAADLI